MVDEFCGSEPPFQFCQFPKIAFFLSIKKPDGSEIRLNPYHMQFLLYLQLLPSTFKSLEKMAYELGWSKKTVYKIKKELSYPCVEIGVPLIYISEMKDRNKITKRHQIQVFPYKKELVNYEEKFSENAQGNRERFFMKWSSDEKVDQEHKKSVDFENNFTSVRGKPLSVYEGNRGRCTRETGERELREKELCNNKQPTENYPEPYGSKAGEDSPPSPLKGEDSAKASSIRFNRKKEEWEGVTNDFLEEMKDTYPNVDIQQEMKKAKQWLISNPNKRKVNYRRFLTTWFSNNQKQIKTKGPKHPDLHKNKEYIYKVKTALEKQNISHKITVYGDNNFIDYTNKEVECGLNIEHESFKFYVDKKYGIEEGDLDA